MKKILLILLSLGILLYAGIIVYLKANETTMIFYQVYGQGPLKAPADSVSLNIEKIVLDGTDSVKLVGWLIRNNPDSLNPPYILFFHGNASNIAYPDYIGRYSLFSKLGMNILTVDYRGFGESSGEPTEKGCYNDALTMYNYLTQAQKIAPERIIIYGHSLGAAVAIDLATKVKAACLVSEAGFQSVPKMAFEMYPFLPMRLLVKHKFLSIEKVDKIAMPKLFIHSRTDEVITFSHGEALFSKATEPKTFLEISGTHDAAPLQDSEKYSAGLVKFLEGTEAHLIH